jgi:hypothetical protein
MNAKKSSGRQHEATLLTLRNMLKHINISRFAVSIRASHLLVPAVTIIAEANHVWQMEPIER